MKNIEFYYEKLLQQEVMANMRKFALEKGMKEGEDTSVSQDLIIWLNEEHQILDDVEKEYLGNIIRPLKTKQTTVKKLKVTRVSDKSKYEYILISGTRDMAYSLGILALPTFKKGTMYTGMELNKEYTLEELGL